MSDYWTECIETAAEECGIVLTAKQVEWLAGAAEGCHENYSLAFYTPTESPYKREAEDLKRKLAEERSKITCKKCGGSGRDICQGPCHSSESDCFYCRGEGRVLP